MRRLSLALVLSLSCLTPWSVGVTRPLPAVQKGEVIVYIIPKGYSYHASKKCQTLRRSKVIEAITLAKAGELGRTPCRMCNPVALPVEGIKFNMDYLEKTWGIKYKSHSIRENTVSGTSVKQLRLLFEFTKDVENPKEVQQAFGSSFTLPVQGKVKVPIWFYCFDEDNVSLGKFPLSGHEGEISCKKGEAFRAIVSIYSETFKKTRKIEVRPGEK